MKWLFTLVFSFLSLGICAQQKNNHTIKIYLEDAERGRNIDDAKVTLEGFEIPVIIGQYDKKGKFYYFDKIPTGYNTIMAYHKKYNEKGFQNLEGLPGELKLRLYDPLNVSYEYQSNTYEESKQDIFVEDPYKIAIFSNDQEDYNLFKDYLYNELNKLKLDIEVVNPYLESDKDKNSPYPFGNNHFLEQKEPYPKIKTFNLRTTDDFILPLIGGYSTEEYYYGDDRRYKITAKEVAFYFRKKNGAKFKRFNDPILKKIRLIKRINTASLIYLKYMYESTNKKKHYKNKYTNKLDEQNQFTRIDSSKIFFYNNFLNLKAMMIPTQDRFGMRLGSYYPVTNEFLIQYKSNILNEQNHVDNKNVSGLKCAKGLIEVEPSTGLGILDQYENLSKCLGQKF
ncbi:hypothetical protein [Flavobacterium sp. LC2016-12]|uniref:hypothetical protein n=1 Tax=Flavobacterium sp. LC2016-12 TaxID=2783794 RepID=UPI00188D40D2|nr:hypothetical protein [Flavobacterium sp. LC2016-12]MBF4466803.1 hypothetical protein [Flavobacterium sp. LC2016-12]